MSPQRAADLAGREDLRRDVLGLPLGVIQRDVERLLRRLAHSEQRLAVLPRALRHQRVGRIEYRLRGAVVLRQHDHLGLRLESVGEPQDIVHRCGAERVDGLSVVADHGDAAAVRLQRLNDLALQRARILVLIDQHVIEIAREALRERRILHHRVPVEQQVVEIQHVVLLLARDVLAVKAGQILLPLAHPRKLLIERLLERKPRVDAVAVDREARILARKTLVLVREPELVPDHIHEVGRIRAVEHGEVGIQPEMLGEQPQDAIADRVKRAGPQQAALHAAIARLAAFLEHGGHDGLRAADHFLRGAAREGQHQDARRVDAVQHQMSGAMRQRIGLAGSRAGQDEQRTRADAFVLDRRAEGGGTALLGVERVERVGLLGLHHDENYTVYCMDIQIASGYTAAMRQDRAF